MKKLLLVWLIVGLIIPNIVSAADWVLIGRDTLLEGNKYIDKETVVKDGNKAVFWLADVLDKPFGKCKKFLHKYEVDLTNHKYRPLEWHVYDSNNRELVYRMDDELKKWVDYSEGCIISEDINEALKFSVLVQDSGLRPTLP